MRAPGSVDGLLLVDKPTGCSSNHALQRVRRLYGGPKAGHGGTLDPAASGLLVICLGQATKFSGFLLDSDKGYTGLIRLGVTTSTGDSEGEVIDRRHVPSETVDVAKLQERFSGTLLQVPPRHSALKLRGRPLYSYARAGLAVAPEARRVTILDLQLQFEPPDGLRFAVRCTRGTYIRSLAEDIGRDIGCGAHLASLRRVSSGEFRVEEALSPEALEALSLDARLRRLLAPDVALRAYPAVRLCAQMAQAVSFGQAVSGADEGSLGRARLYDEHGRFLGLGEVREGGIVAPIRMMSPGSDLPVLPTYC